MPKATFTNRGGLPARSGGLEQTWPVLAMSGHGQSSPPAPRAAPQPPAPQLMAAAAW